MPQGVVALNGGAYETDVQLPAGPAHGVCVKASNLSFGVQHHDSPWEAKELPRIEDERGVGVLYTVGFGSGTALNFRTTGLHQYHPDPQGKAKCCTR
jgi:hypothetical protein